MSAALVATLPLMVVIRPLAVDRSADRLAIWALRGSVAVLTSAEQSVTGTGTMDVPLALAGMKVSARPPSRMYRKVPFGARWGDWVMSAWNPTCAEDPPAPMVMVF